MFPLNLFRGGRRKRKQGRGSRRQARQAAPRFEPLEDRRLLSVIQWTGGGDGKSWQDANNWGGALPGVNDWAEIGPTFAAQAITSSGDVSVWRLTSDAPFQLAGGTFTATNMLQVNNTLMIRGGTLENTTVDAGTGGQGIVLTPSGGTLDDVQAACNLDLATYDGASVHIANGLSLFDATVQLGSAAGTTGRIIFDATESLAGTDSTVLFGSSGSNGLFVGNGNALTIGAGITVGGSSGMIGGGAGTLINMGTIAAYGGGTIAINADAFANQGALEVGPGETMNITGLTGNLNAASLSGNGATLSVSGDNWVNNEALSIPQEGTLSFGGSWTNDSPITAADEANVDLTGAWTNFSTIAATNSWLRLGDQSSASANAWNNAGTISAPNSWVGLGGAFTLERPRRLQRRRRNGERHRNAGQHGHDARLQRRDRLLELARRNDPGRHAE